MITESPVEEKFTNHIFPLEDNRYPREPWVAQNRLEEALRITYCDSLGLPSLDQHLVLDEVAREVGERVGADFAVAGTNGFGLRMAGLSDYDLFGELSDDGEPSSHNIPVNDADIHILTFEKKTSPDIMDGIRAGVLSGAERMVSVHPGIKHLTPYEVKTSGTNAWDMPSYLSLRLFYFRHTPVDTLEIHHQNIPNGDWSGLWNNYQPSKSNLIGSPIYLGIPRYRNGNFDRFCHFVLNPYDTESTWAEPHNVGLSSPEIFGSTVFSIPQTARVYFSLLTHSMATGVPARIDKNSSNIMARAVATWASTLTEEQKLKAEKRFRTLAHRANSLFRSIKSPVSELSHLTKSLGNFSLNLAQNLDEIEWGKKVLGKSCVSLLDPSPEF